MTVYALRSAGLGGLVGVLLVSAGCGAANATRELDLQSHHPNGSVVRLTKISSTGAQVRLDVVATNGFERPIRLNSNRDMVLQDASGAVLALAPPPENPQVTVAPQQTLRGSFVFEAGEGKRAGGNFTLVTNSRLGSASYSRSDRPQFRIAIAEGQSAKPRKLPEAVKLDQQANHPNGTVLRVTQVNFSEDAIQVGIAATNGFEKPVRLNDNRSLVLTDNLGNRYSLAPPPDNPEVTVMPQATLNLQAMFLGRLHPTANQLTLVTNERLGSADYNRSDRPQLRLGISIPK